jgi:hypothetical protein
MNISEKTTEILHLLDESKSNLTKIRTLAKEIGKNQPLADAIHSDRGSEGDYR